MQGRLPITEAIRTLRYPIVETLIQHGAPANASEPTTGVTAVRLSFHHNLVDIARLLLVSAAWGAAV